MMGPAVRMTSIGNSALAKIAALVGITMLGGCAILPNKASAPRAHSATSADGVNIAYQRGGTRGQTIVLIHGWSCDQTYWNSQWADFSRDYDVITLDLAGHGASGQDREQWTIGRFGDDVAAVVNDAGVDNVILVGHSMGGPVMLEAARRLEGRVALMIGVDTLKIPEEHRTRAESEARWSGLATDFAQSVEGFARAQFFLPDADPTLVDTIAKDMAAAPADIAISAGVELGMYNPAIALNATRDVPIALLNAEQPPTDTDAYARVRNDVKVSILHDLGHFPMLESPAVFNAALRDTILSHLP